MNKQEQEREQELDDIRSVMRMEAGRRFVARLLSESRIYQTSFAGQSNQTIFNEGMRNMGLFVFSEVEEACPNLLLEMMQEGINERRSEHAK